MSRYLMQCEMKFFHSPTTVGFVNLGDQCLPNMSWLRRLEVSVPTDFDTFWPHLRRDWRQELALIGVLEEILQWFLPRHGQSSGIKTSALPIPFSVLHLPQSHEHCGTHQVLSRRRLLFILHCRCLRTLTQ